MRCFLKKFIAEQRGDALILVALSFIGLLGMTGLAIDGSLLFMTKSELQKVADGAVLSGAQELTNNEQAVDQVMQNILNADRESATLEGEKIDMDQQVSIDLAKPVHLTFASLFGFKQVDVTAHAAAGLTTLGRALGAAPLGIDESIPEEYNKVYQLKVDSSGVNSGDFGVLALGGPGAATYEDNLLYGYQDELKVGDVIDTQTGNIAGDTISAVQQLINECTAPPGDYTARNCSRIILIPVYKPYDSNQNQLKSVQITGFAYFYITQPMSSTDTSITGMFIQRAGTGSYESGSVDRGAYSIRLTE